jgi:hypothetical protein
MSNAWVCPIHGTVKFVPPGVSSKTGKPYTGFFCCPERGCGQRPPKAGMQTAPQQAPVAPAKPAPNWDRIAEGKCRSLAICAWIQSGRPLSEFWDYERGFLTYMMQGSVPGMDERWEPAIDDTPFPEA